MRYDFLFVQDLDPQVSYTKQQNFLIDSSDVTNFVYLQDYIFGAGAIDAKDLLLLFGARGFRVLVNGWKARVTHFISINVVVLIKMIFV